MTDFPEHLDRVGFYLDSVHDRVHRQVQIDARVVEVELSDPNAQSLDWTALVQSGIDPGSPSGSRPNVSGLRVADVKQFLAALAAQGRVSVLARPSVLTLNNEPALLRATSQSAATPGEGSREDGVTLAVTP